MCKVREILLTFIMFLPGFLFSQSQGSEFLNLERENVNGLEISYKLPNVSIEKVSIEGVDYIKPLTPGCFLPGKIGYPDLVPSTSFICVPVFSDLKYELIVQDSFIIRNAIISPAPDINRMDNAVKFNYIFNQDIYSKDIDYPEKIISVSQKFKIRGINLVSFSYTPYRYNAIKKELTVYKKVKVKIIFEHPSGSFYEPRLRSKWFDPVITKYILNRKSIERVYYNESLTGYGYEYIIITPNNLLYNAVADTLRRFRNSQGIKTNVYKLSDIGGNNFFAIKNFLKNAYLNWEITPVAVLLMADEGENADNRIYTPYYNNQFITDFRYADMNDDHIPDMIVSRMPVDNESQLYNIVRNIINYEENPPLLSSYYNKPITAMGWETSNWFQICSEVVGGFFRNKLGKNTSRINDVYSGNPLTDPWSTAPNTQNILNYFGPAGLNYIPTAPQQLGGFIGGTPDMVLSAINTGSFFLLHRDHGNYTGWGKPGFNVNHINLLTNQYPVNVFSINCQNGKFNWTGGSCFSEKFIQHYYNGCSGSVSVISASDLSYPFLNDVFTWGVMDNFWENFIPEYTSQFNHGFIFPAFANVSGKYFLAQSQWVSDPLNKIETYYLFHHFGDCFSSMFTEVPGILNLFCQDYIFEGEKTLAVSTDSGALIGISNKGDFISSQFSSGGVSQIVLNDYAKYGDTIIATATKRNSKRINKKIPVSENPDIYLFADNYWIFDEPPLGNGNGKIDYSEINDLSFTIHNRGLKSAYNIKAVLSSSDPYVHISDSVFTLNKLNSKDSVICLEEFRYFVNANIPDSHLVNFKMTLSAGKQIWDFNFSFIGFAPVLNIGKISVTDSTSNNNGLIEPGDTVYVKLPVKNSGSSQALKISAKMNLNSLQYINIISDSLVLGSINPKDSAIGKFKLYVKPVTPNGTIVKFYFKLYSQIDGKMLYDSLKIVIGGINTVYIGKGTKNIIYPYSLYYMDGRTEMLYTASELDSNGALAAYITKIGFYANSTNSIPLNNFTIKIKYTNDTAIKNFTNSGWSICLIDTVFISTQGWNIYNLQTPFYWDGLRNVLISVCYDNYFYSFNTYSKGTIISGRTVAAYFDLSSGSGCEIMNGSAFNDRPNIAIEFNEIIEVGNNTAEVPSEFKLFSNYPNPFNSSTKIKYQIPEKSFIEIIIYDILGREITTIERNNKLPGTYLLEWQCGEVPSGVYLCRMKTQKYSASIKLLHIK